MNRLITYVRHLFGSIKKVSNWSLVRQHSAYYPQNIEGCSVEYAVVFDNGHQAVCDYRNIDLYSHSILSIAPKGRNTQMLLNPSEEKFNLPSLLIQQGDIAGLECEVICQERERSLQFRSIVNNSPESTRIFLLGLIACKAYRLVKQNIICTVEQIFTINNLIVEMRLLSNDEVRVNNVDSIQPGKVIIALVKDVKRIRLIRNVIHRIHVMDFSLRDMNVGRYLSHNIKQGVNLDTSLRCSEECPLKQTQTEIDCGGVKGIKFSMQDKLPVQSLALRKIDHIVSKLFKYLVIPVRIGVGNIAKLYVSVAKSEMVTLILDGINDANDFSEAVTAGKLSEHHHKKLVSACECLHILVPIVLFDDSIKYSLWQKFNELAENIFSGIHAGLDYIQTAKMWNQFKSTRTIFAYNLLNYNLLQRTSCSFFGH